MGETSHLRDSSWSTSVRGLLKKREIVTKNLPRFIAPSPPKLKLLSIYTNHGLFGAFGVAGTLLKKKEGTLMNDVRKFKNKSSFLTNWSKKNCFNINSITNPFFVTGVWL